MVRLQLVQTLIQLAKLVYKTLFKVKEKRVSKTELSSLLSINNIMAQTKIAELTIAPSILGTDFIIVDNTEVTRRTTLNSLVGYLSTMPSLSSQSYNTIYSLIQTSSGTWSQGNSAINTAVISNSANWNSAYTTVNANSATWSQGNSAVNSAVTSSSANWNNTYTVVNTNSAAWSSTITKSTAIQGSTLIFTSKTNETIYLDSTSASPLSAILVQLPNYLNSFVGQVKIFISSKDITTVSVSVQSGGSSTIVGNILSFTNAFEPKTYQCIDITGTTVTWLRIS